MSDTLNLNLCHCQVNNSNCNILDSISEDQFTLYLYEINVKLKQFGEFKLRLRKEQITGLIGGSRMIKMLA